VAARSPGGLRSGRRPNKIEWVGIGEFQEGLNANIEDRENRTTDWLFDSRVRDSNGRSIGKEHSKKGKSKPIGNESPAQFSLPVPALNGSGQYGIRNCGWPPARLGLIPMAARKLTEIFRCL
jgi:hypothetical protein